jgi:hypothetical protein
VKLGCVLLYETNSGWMAKYKAAMDYKVEHMNKELDGRLTCRRGAPGCLNRGWPAVLDRPAWVACCSSRLRFSSSTLIFTFMLCERMLHGLHHPTLSSTPLLALLVLPLDVFVESPPYSFASHASMIFLQNKALLPPMLVLCMCL